MTPPIRVSAPVARPRGRVVADVDGGRVWFESSDADLRPSPEAFGSAMWVPALAHGSDLGLLAPVDSLWKANLDRIATIARAWWGYDSRTVTAEGQRTASPRRPGQMLCFTAGVDSFHSLLKLPLPPAALVYVAGFDVRLRDTARLAAVEASIRAVAAAADVRAIVLRTNLRRHPAFRTAPWNNTHGGALAAAGHLLVDIHGTMITSSTHARDDGRPWGSDWRLDPLWSATDLELVHVGADVPRERKLTAVAESPLVQAHLRVCWEHRNASLNCGHCDKCLATMVILSGLGLLERFATFDGSDELPERLNRLPATRYLAMYPRVLAGGVPLPVGSAVERLLERSAQGPARR